MPKQRKPGYQVCDHPGLFIKDGICYLCSQFDGQTDALAEVPQ